MKSYTVYCQKEDQTVSLKIRFGELHEPAEEREQLSAVKTALFIDTVAQWGVIESIFYPVVSGAPQEKASGTPLVPREVVVLNGSEIEGGRRFVDN